MEAKNFAQNIRIVIEDVREEIQELQEELLDRYKQGKPFTAIEDRLRELDTRLRELKDNLRKAESIESPPLQWALHEEDDNQKQDKRRDG